MNRQPPRLARWLLLRVEPSGAARGDLDEEYRDHVLPRRGPRRAPCADSQLAIEVDGALHLGDAEAYRSGRRKDRLLQEHRYTVLRFLAENLAKDLDTVLDTILRALTHQATVKIQQRNN